MAYKHGGYTSEVATSMVAVSYTHLGYYMDYAPAPILVMQPTLDMGQTFSKDRLAPMIRDTPELRDKIDVKSRYSGNTIMKKNFPGGHITIVGANSATGLASRPIKVLLADEVDRYPASAGTVSYTHLVAETLRALP